jgi:hypothetical protein
VLLKNAVRCLSVAALLVATTSVSFAQGEGRQHRHHARSFGMFPGVAPVFVLGHQAVQQELGIRPDQTEKVNQLVAEAREEWSQQAQAAGGGSRGRRNSTTEEGQTRPADTWSKLAAVSKNVNDKYRSKLAEVLDKPQQTRLYEIALQAAGTHAFQDADVARELGLTKAQQDQLVAVHHEYAGKFAELRTQGEQQDRTQRFAKMNELRQEELAKSTDVLTKDQQAKFSTMKGKSFDLAQLHHGRGHHGNHNKSDKSA